MSLESPLWNYILFQVDKEQENALNSKIGTLYLDSSFEPGKHARIYGQVVGVPKRLSSDIILWREEEGLPQPQCYYDADMVKDMARIQGKGQQMSVAEQKVFDKRMRDELYTPSTHTPTYKKLSDVVPEVKVGDKIYFHYNTVREDNLVPSSDGRKVYKVRYDNILCAVRTELNEDGVVEKNIIPIASHVLVDAVWDEEVEEISLPGFSDPVKGRFHKSGKFIESLHQRPKPLEGKIAHIGTPLVGDVDLGLQSGDEVYYMPESDWINRIEGKDYYIMKQKDIIAKK